MFPALLTSCSFFDCKSQAGKDGHYTPIWNDWSQWAQWE